MPTTSSSSIGWFFDPKKVATLPLLIIAILVEFFLLVMGNLFFGAAYSGYTNVIFIYMAVTIALIGASGWQVNQMTYFGAIALFTPAFFITGIIIGGLVNTSFLTTKGVDYVVLQILLQIFVVALSEEIIFRGILINYVGVIPQAILFALFHWAAYTAEFGGISTSVVIAGIFEAMVMGVLLGYIVKYVPKQWDPLAITWGIHAGWNVALSTGIFSALFFATSPNMIF